MEGVTLAIAAAACFAVLAVRPAMALVIYFAALAWYPQYLSVQVGTIDFTVSRLVILALAVKVLTTADLVRGFRWCSLDRFVILALVGTMVSGLAMGEDPAGMLENRGGTLLDTVVPYFVVRMVVTSRGTYLTILKGLLWIAAPLAIVGAYQSLTGHNPFGFLHAYYAWGRGGLWEPSARFGLFRAEVTFSHYIMFGLFFAMVGPWCAGLWHYARRHRTLLAAGLALMAVGLVSSLSSGPILAASVTVPVLGLFAARRRWRVFVGAAFLGILAIDILSNRTWYEVLASYGTFSSATAYYRIFLIREALGGGMAGHWFFGYGMHSFASNARWQYGDIVNHYILVLFRYGLVGLVPFIGAIAAACVRLRQGFARARSRAERWLVWSLMSSLLGMLAAMFSVSLFGQPTHFFHLLLGLCGAMPVVMAQVERRPAYALAESASEATAPLGLNRV